MSHVDPEQLALLALGEPVESAADHAHLTICADCAADLTAMRHAAFVGRAAVDDSGLETPPERVWQRISDELGLAGDGGSGSSDEEPSTAEAAPATDALNSRGAVESVAPTRRGHRTLWVLAASLALVLGIGAGVWGILGAVRPTEVAAASLDPFPDHPGATGTAIVEEERDGTVRLTVTLDAAAADGYREVWLIRSDASALISLGILDGESGSFAVPDGVDLTEFSLVDISVEPIDRDVDETELRQVDAVGHRE